MFFEPLEQFELVSAILHTFPHNCSYLASPHHVKSLMSFFCFYGMSVFDLLGITTWNKALYRIILIFFILIFLVYGFNKGGFVWPQKWQLFVEMIYGFLAGMFKEQVGYRGQKYFPFLATIFIFVFLLNLFGMIPYAGAITSQLIFNLSLSFSVLVYLTIIGYYRQGVFFFKLFLPPEGVPKVLNPLIIFIEIISYVARGVSLGVRLFANIMAGHTLLFIFSSFILQVNLILGFSIFIVIFLVTFLEFFIAILQAYVFYVLVIIYFRDSIEVSH